MNQIAAKIDQPLIRPLKVLIPLIKEDLEKGDEAAKQAGMAYYKAAGEKMIEAKPQVKNFSTWIKKTFGISPRQAQFYMSYARATISKQIRSEDHESIRDFRRRHLGHNIPTSGFARREWQPDVDDIAERARRDMERLQQEEMTRKQEREAQQQLGLRLIDIGYKVLAKELHPDSGGSREAMQRLSVVRNHLKASL